MSLDGHVVKLLPKGQQIVHDPLSGALRVSRHAHRGRTLYRGLSGLLRGGCRTPATWGAPPEESAAARFSPSSMAGLFSMDRVKSLSVHRVRLPFFHPAGAPWPVAQKGVLPRRDLPLQSRCEGGPEAPAPSGGPPAGALCCGAGWTGGSGGGTGHGRTGSGSGTSNHPLHLPGPGSSGRGGRSSSQGGGPPERLGPPQVSSAEPGPAGDRSARRPGSGYGDAALGQALLQPGHPCGQPGQGLVQALVAQADEAQLGVRAAVAAAGQVGQWHSGARLSICSSRWAVNCSARARMVVSS